MDVKRGRHAVGFPRQWDPQIACAAIGTTDTRSGKANAPRSGREQGEFSHRAVFVAFDLFCFRHFDLQKAPFQKYRILGIAPLELQM
jgi:hypothetical protein